MQECFKKKGEKNVERRLFTSESVTEGHPDKMCDQISDAILDALMAQDPMSRVACETATTTGMVLVMGEITTNAYVDIQKIVRDTIKEIGYTRGKFGFDAETCGVITAIDEQSADIAMGVDKALEAKEHTMSEEEIDAIGAGDQGMMFGYASDETPEYMPYPIALAHKLSRKLTEVRKNGTLPYLRPDGKTQVTVEYDENGVPARLDAVVLSTQHDPEVTQDQIHKDIKKYVFDAIIPEGMVDEKTKFFINPTGRFVIGGPHGDSGLTGRKIIGLAQLHQLRGRVGRGKHQSYCIFMSASKSKETKKRLDILNHSNDGFKIASEDLRLRGPGDLFGIRQSGLMNFKLGDVYQDAKILQMANEAADQLTEEDEEWIRKLPNYENAAEVVL